MAATQSKMLALGTSAPDFHLLDVVSAKKLSLAQLRGEKATVVMFLCNHCPFVKHVNEGLVTLAKDYQSKGVAFVAISSNDIQNYPQDAPGPMKLHAKVVGYPFPYLFDETQSIAKAYQAACTPDFYVFDAKLKCAYRGQLDDSRPGNNIPVSGKDIRQALEALLAGKSPSTTQKPSMGCNIKWS